MRDHRLEVEPPRAHQLLRALVLPTPAVAALPNTVTVFSMIGTTGSGGRSLAKPMRESLPSFRTRSRHIAEDAGNPDVSITMSAPAPRSVRSATAAFTSVCVTFRQCVAP